MASNEAEHLKRQIEEATKERQRWAKRARELSYQLIRQRQNDGPEGLYGATDTLVFIFLHTASEVSTAAAACTRWQALATSNVVWSELSKRSGILGNANALDMDAPRDGDIDKAAWWTFYRQTYEASEHEPPRKPTHADPDRSTGDRDGTHRFTPGGTTLTPHHHHHHRDYEHLAAACTARLTSTIEEWSSTGS